VAYAGHRQNRTFLPPPEYNPLAPSRDPDNPTEVPEGPWDVAVFENLFPDAHGRRPRSAIAHRRDAAGQGACEVVVFTQDATSLGSLPLWHIELLLDVWAHRTEELGARDDVQYVFPFENRGVEVGVTLHHPHGQIYAYPFVPPIAARELSQQRAYFERTGRGCSKTTWRRNWRTDRSAFLYAGDAVVAFVPVCARYPYEVWIAPRRPCRPAGPRRGRTRRFARALKTVLLKYDGLWQRPFPYIMVFHQAPTDGARRIPRRTCTSSSIPRTACRTA
jgi:UDPglucose--hexose-1-phosphate uridylyltransferase